MSIILRDGLGRPLTHVELDSNFTTLEGSVTTLDSTKLIDIEVVARSLNVLDSQVIYSTNTITVLDNVLYIYDAGQIVTYAKPSGIGASETIVSVTGDQLTTNIGTYTLLDTTHVDKEYVDELDSENVKLIGPQSIDDIKTFTSSPIVPTPTNATQAVNKDYADGFVNQTDIIGTVSELAGVPTGALFESGSNANGLYTKFADGTMICVNPTPFIADNTTDVVITYPASFISTPSVSFSRKYGGVTAAESEIVRFEVYAGASGWVYSLNVSTFGNLELSFTAIGRWF